MNKILQISFLVIVMTALFSCGEKKEGIPADIIPRAKMIQLMADVQLVEAAIQLRNLGMTDSTKQLAYGYYKFTFEKYKVSANDFLKSYQYYQSNPELMELMYKDIITEISRKQAVFVPKDSTLLADSLSPVDLKKDSALVKKFRQLNMKNKFR